MHICSSTNELERTTWSVEWETAQDNTVEHEYEDKTQQLGKRKRQQNENVPQKSGFVDTVSGIRSNVETASRKKASKMVATYVCQNTYPGAILKFSRLSHTGIEKEMKKEKYECSDCKKMNSKTVVEISGQKGKEAYFSKDPEEQNHSCWG